MDRDTRTILLGLVLVGTVAACSGTTSPSAGPVASRSSEPGASGSAATATNATQTSEGGQVTVVATWAGPGSGASFDVALDTHSVDLDALDLKDATLHNDRGEKLTPGSWAAPKGGHHRQGTLTFTGDAPSFFAGAKWVELILTGVGDLPERTLHWAIGS